MWTRGLKVSCRYSSVNMNTFVIEVIEPGKDDLRSVSVYLSMSQSCVPPAHRSAPEADTKQQSDGEVRLQSPTDCCIPASINQWLVLCFTASWDCSATLSWSCICDWPSEEKFLHHYEGAETIRQNQQDPADELICKKHALSFLMDLEYEHIFGKKKSTVMIVEADIIEVFISFLCAPPQCPCCWALGQMALRALIPDRIPPLTPLFRTYCICSICFRKHLYFSGCVSSVFVSVLPWVTCSIWSGC